METAPKTHASKQSSREHVCAVGSGGSIGTLCVGVVAAPTQICPVQLPSLRHITVRGFVFFSFTGFGTPESANHRAGESPVMV